MKMKKVTGLLAMTVAAVMAMTGCGGNDAADESTGNKVYQSALFSRWSTVLWIRQQRALRIS